MSKSNFLKKSIILLAGLFIMAFGVAFSIKAELGTSPISSLPYVTGLMFNITIGTTTIIMHCVLIILQIIILRKNYSLFQLLQFPVAFIFGYMTDFAVYVTNFISLSSYLGKWIICIIGIVFVAIGVILETLANLVPLAGEGTVLAICSVTNIEFSKMKVAFDTTLVVISIVLSLVFLKGLFGIREGTIAAALLVGILTKIIKNFYHFFKKHILSVLPS